MVLKNFWYNFVLENISFTKLGYDWSLISKNIDDDKRKNYNKIDILTGVRTLVIKNSNVRN